MAHSRRIYLGITVLYLNRTDMFICYQIMHPNEYEQLYVPRLNVTVLDVLTTRP